MDDSGSFGRFLVHAGPKRTASTWMQKHLTKVIFQCSLDQTSHEGNSHNLLLSLTRFTSKISSPLETDRLSLTSDELRKCLTEIQRLSRLLHSGGDVVLSCELFTHIHPEALQNAFNIPERSHKCVVFVYRNTTDLLKSLYANDVAAGYRGTATDFIDDVMLLGNHSSDLFHEIEPWSDMGWDVKVVEFQSTQLSSTFLDIFRDFLNCTESYAYETLEERAESHTYNKSLSPEVLFRISQFSNALHEYSADLILTWGVPRFINRVLIPYLRDSPYSAKDFELTSSEKWGSFVSHVEEKRRIKFRRYIELNR
jgi:hypothetical protein